MKLTIEGTSEEIKKALQAISSSEERGESLKLSGKSVILSSPVTVKDGLKEIKETEINPYHHLND